MSVDAVARGLAAYANSAAGISAAGGVVTQTKRAMLTISAPAGVATTTVTNKLERFAAQLPVTTKRWRIRVRNWGPYAGSLGTADVVLSDLYIGEAAISTTGTLTGAFAAAPTKVLDGASLGTAGALYVSDWVTDPAKQFQAAKTYLVSQAFTTTNGGTIASGSQFATHAVVNGTGFANVGTTGVPSGTAIIVSSHLDRIIEYDFDSAVGTPVGFIVGDSIAVGVCNTSFPVRGDQMFHARFGLSNGSPIATGGISGYTTANFTTALNGLYSRFDLGGSFIPDFAIIQIGINDVSAVQQPTVIEAAIISIVNILKGFGIKRVYLCTLGQRMNTGVTGYFSRTTLTADASIGATSITTQDIICPDTSLGEFITFEPTVANEERVQASSASTGSPGSYATTVPALAKAHASGSVVQSTGETYRDQYNIWVRGVPAGISGVFDFDKALRDPASIHQMLAALTVDTLHPNAAGHQAMAQVMALPPVI